MTDDTPPLGIVIPTLDEAARLPRLLEDLRALPMAHSVVVADGGSRDGTVERAARLGASVVRTPRGRSRQMNAGAWALDTPWLLFLHADSRLPAAAGTALARWLRSASPRTAAHFRFALEGDDPFWRFLELGQRIRERVSGLAYGDQGLLVHRRLFTEIGGYPDQPLMEDVALLRTLRRVGRVERIDATLPTSPRRYVEEGKWRGWLRNSALIFLYLVGVPPERLAGWYPRGRAAPSPPGTSPSSGSTRIPTPPGASPSDADRSLLVFAKAPVTGRVKTRLAADLGAEGAARLYRRMGGGIVRRLLGGRYRTVVCFDPPDGEDAIRDWLGPDVELRPQAAGDLGARMEEALRSALRSSRAACIVGTDAPGVDIPRVEDAFEALRESDVVFGPARDGGYYLVGMRELHPGLFRDIPWSTPAVLARSLERAESAGLRVALLPPLDDVDDIGDLHPGILEGLEAPAPIRAEGSHA